ncbi:MAG: hypothetical protein SVR04_16130, partial [Spirochaetota bacterium]|nr:hypothetical protein [Spirochaetota bacterium]
QRPGTDRITLHCGGRGRGELPSHFPDVQPHIWYSIGSSFMVAAPEAVTGGRMESGKRYI